MTQPSWAAQVTALVAGQIRRYRKHQGMSAQGLAERCEELGLPLPRSTLADLENGRRANVTLAELAVLAAALGVSPVELAFPLGEQDMVEVLPGVKLATWAAARWFRGDARLIRSTSDDAWTIQTPDSNDLVIDYFTAHQRLVDSWRGYLAIGEVLTGLHGQEPGVHQLTDRQLKEQMRIHQQQLVLMEVELAQHRRIMRDEGITPPPPPPELARIDDLADADVESLIKSRATA